MPANSAADSLDQAWELHVAQTGEQDAEVHATPKKRKSSASPRSGSKTKPKPKAKTGPKGKAVKRSIANKCKGCRKKLEQLRTGLAAGRASGRWTTS